MRRGFGLTVLTAALGGGSIVKADSAWLYGIHWWTEASDNNPAIMLDCPTYGGWDVETVLTHDAAWWAPSFFAPLYSTLYNTKNMTMITRIDYKWGETVPSPSNPDYAGWPSACVSAVNTLRHYSHLWVIGNEPNIVSEGGGWPDNKITPSGYATIYRNVRNAIRSSAGASPAGSHLVLIAGPSPGGVVPGVRWMDGNQWLGQVIDNIPNSEIDGFAIHSYGGSVTDFHNTYVSQLNLIDSKGLQDRPVYITEWNRYTDPNNPTQEPTTAQFCRDSFADLNSWNQTVGNHNIRCLCWFVYASKGWDGHSIDYWRTHGNPPGDPGDLYTAFQQTVDLRYPAGLVGTRPAGPQIELSPTSFTRQVYEGDSLPDDLFTVRNVGPGTLNYSITDNAAWLSVNPQTGTSTGEADPIAVIYAVEDLPVGGPYQCIITVSAPGADNTPQRLTVSLAVETSPYAPVDFERDGDVDQVDFATFFNCMTGPALGPPDAGCQKADVDEDGDVDQTDFGYFQRCLSGPGNPANPNCAD